MRTRIETQKISARLDICQVTCLNRLGMDLVGTSGDAPFYFGRRLREASAAIATSCRHGLEAVAAAADMHPTCMSLKPRLGWLVLKPVRLHSSVG